jgi:hypothetical protein
LEVFPSVIKNHQSPQLLYDWVAHNTFESHRDLESVKRLFSLYPEVYTDGSYMSYIIGIDDGVTKWIHETHPNPQWLHAFIRDENVCGVKGDVGPAGNDGHGDDGYRQSKHLVRNRRNTQISLNKRHQDNFLKRNLKCSPRNFKCGNHR